MVLVVDDVMLNRYILGRMLRQLGLEVREAENGAEALTMLQSCHDQFSAVLLDLCMPVLNGWDTVRAVRQMEADEALPHLPIFCCTSESLEEIAAHPDVTLYSHSLQSGFDECMAKPPTRELLLRKLQKHVPVTDWPARPSPVALVF